MPEPTPEQDAEVRRLLADARHDAPMPPEVVARLDAVLAGLAAEGARLGSRAPVVDLAARRRRRVRGVLVAAAVAVVVGVGAGRLVDLGSTSGGEASSSADRAAGGSSLPEAGERPDERPGALPAGRSGPAQERAFAAAAAPRVAAGSFAADVARIGAGGAEGDVRALAAAMRRPAIRVCAPVRGGTGRRIPVRYDGVPAVLVLRPAEGGSRVVDLYACGGGTVERSVTLPAR